MAKRFINETSSVVVDAIDGFIQSTPNVTRIDGYPDVKVVLRSDWDKNAGKVSVICGGGSGHEPSFAGMVGEGMLTAAVCGNVFASPSQDAVLAAIVATSGPAGCLLVSMNYTGDRFCFGLAAARAKNEHGIDCKFVRVGDDKAIPDAKQARGLGGTLFVLKAAGAAASAGESLDYVEAIATKTADKCGSLGVSFSSCTKPGDGKQEERMTETEMEVGLGIHGEPGFKKMPIGNADSIAKLIAESLLKTVKNPDAQLAVMVGNLGSVPPLEMSLFTGCLLKYMKAKYLVGPALLMTSLDMNGIQVSILELEAGMGSLLLAPTSARAWPGAIIPNAPALVPSPLKAAAVEASPVKDAAVEALMKKTCEAMIKAAPGLNEIDAKVGDGDCGDTMKAGAEMVLAILNEPVSTASPKKLFTAIGGKFDKLGGSSGVLLSIMLTTMAGELGEDAKFTRATLAPAFEKGVATLMHIGGAKPGMRTMVDVLEPVSKALASSTGAEIKALAKEKADATAHVKSTTCGRSMYLNEDSLAGIKDPGALAMALVVEELASAF